MTTSPCPMPTQILAFRIFWDQRCSTLGILLITVRVSPMGATCEGGKWMLFVSRVVCYHWWIGLAVFTPSAVQCCCTFERLFGCGCPRVITKVRYLEVVKRHKVYKIMHGLTIRYFCCRESPPAPFPERSWYPFGVALPFWILESIRCSLWNPEESFFYNLFG